MSINTFTESTRVKVIKSFIIDGKSHRRIQEEVLNIEAPSRGGGFETMKILHHYGMDGSKKGILRNKRALERELQFATGNYKEGLELLTKYYKYK